MPDWKKEIRKLVRGLSLTASRETEIVEELSQHLEDRYQEMLASGMNADEANRASVIGISNSKLLADELRRVESRVNIEPVVFGSRRRT